MEIVVGRSPRLSGRIPVAGSKNYTSRWLLAATLAAGTSIIENPAPIDDAAAMLEACRLLGAKVQVESNRITVEGTGGHLRAPETINVRNAGAVARFLMAVAALAPQPVTFVTPYPTSLGRRPHGDLLDALEQLGVAVASNEGRLPITIDGRKVRPGEVRISCERSSQYLSALLFLTPLLPGPSRILVQGELRSAPAIRQTLGVLAEAGIKIDAADDLRTFDVPGPQAYQSGRRTVPGDWPGASALLCAAAVTEGEVEVTGLYDDAQGERAAVDVLKAMGADIHFDPRARVVTVRGGAPLRPVEFDGDLFTDSVMVLATAAAFADGRSRFYNVENLRYKESDRITDLRIELAKIGVRMDERRDEIIVHGKPATIAGGASVDAHFDHRLLMAASVAALRAREPVRLLDADHIAKSYPGYFEDLAALGADIRGDAGLRPPAEQLV